MKEFDLDRCLAYARKLKPEVQALKMFITTWGVGELPKGMELGAAKIWGQAAFKRFDRRSQRCDFSSARRARDRVLKLSDCRPLNYLVAHLLATCPHGIRALRGPIRGGLAAVVNEWAWGCGYWLRLFEAQIPVREEVKGWCELLGLEPWPLASRGGFWQLWPLRWPKKR